tara:strand:- start:270 stop:941 length:672 start_codon:yes stop_codon:yes gene_type:complete
MGILDNDTVIVDAILTKLGRNKLRLGQSLGITQYAFGDTGVDYTLYNPNHPSGSDSYGSAITSLPMLEAVPDDDVFMRSKLYGIGQRGIQNFAFVDLPDGLTRTIYHIPNGVESTAIELKPRVYSAGKEISANNFRFTVLDMRGLKARVEGSSVTGTAFNAADIDKRQLVGTSIMLNAQAAQISRNVTRTVNIELADGGAAPVQVAVTVQKNTAVDDPGAGSS